LGNSSCANRNSNNMHVVRNNRLEEVEDDSDVDFELPDASRQVGSHINQIPLQSAVQTPRLFYGSRFVNQALAIDGGESPLVQNLDPLDPDGRSFDEKVGESLGAVRAKAGGRVIDVTKDAIKVQYDDGTKEDVDLYNGFSFNQKSGIDSRSLVQKGSVFAPKQMLAASSYTDDSGTQNMGLNARIGLAAWKGFSMDDAVPISESFAKRLSAIQYKVIKQPAADNLKTGLSHYRALFPSRYTKEQLAMFDDNGVVKPGTVLKPGDPVILATMPRTLSSGGANIGKLSKALRQSRRDATSVWEGSQEAEVLGARKTRNGVKVVMRYKKPTSEGDKIVLRAGAKATVSKIIPDDRMPHTEDGVPLDMILNPLSLVSRANPSSQHEVRLGNVAKKLGRSLKIPSFLPKGENWNDYINKLEQENGVVSTQKVFDPEGSRWLSKPITVGHGYVLKLHHTSESKSSARGVASYDQNQQPARGGGDMAQAKRFSGLENYGALSGGAYALMRENSTLRGQRNDDYWRSLRTGKPLPKVGVPFVWNKFRALLSGAGISTKEVGRGRFRLAPFVDKDLDDQDPIDIENGEIVNSSTLAPIPGGLFDTRVINGDRWGRIKLPRPVINPSMEDAARVMLGMTKNQMEEIIQGRAELPEALKSRLAMVAPRA
jgi:DNA-directed RNA polymerase subunit beta